MSEYQMNIIGKIELEDYSSIYDYMAIVDKNDNIMITIDNPENINIIKQMLENNSFIVDMDNSSYDGRCLIKAFKFD
ncbi:hypothetical protein [Clostridium thailandense]|uniref:Uncharacterized protein n=1 Tax=Clostridium thailandense TaxID=2794346 RepID=A0A949TXP9_9CLOT|nr:hypothetical protein [Clostridium thailandense]MBV7274478.1 hypothetical protein [Clostridium thailandense]